MKDTSYGIAGCELKESVDSAANACTDNKGYTYKKPKTEKSTATDKSSCKSMCTTSDCLAWSYKKNPPLLTNLAVKACVLLLIVSPGVIRKKTTSTETDNCTIYKSNSKYDSDVCPKPFGNVNFCMKKSFSS